MHIIYIHKDEIQRQPPDISALFILSELGHHVSLITCGMTESLQKAFDERGIQTHVLSDCVGAKSILGKMRQYHRFSKEVKHILQALPSDSILWLEGSATMYCLKKQIRGRAYILQIQELFEKSPRFLKAIGKIIHNARLVFMPEYARTSLYQVWFHLKKRPTVLPNKPYFIPSSEELSKFREKYPEYVKLFSEKKVILYQGHISKDRDLSAFVKAVKQLGAPYQLVLMGQDHGVLEKYKSIDPNIVHIDFIPAPYYLLMTSMAHVGLLGYTPMSENNIFCAPNKIFEYAAFGLPIIGNDIPGLYYPIKQFHSGEIVCDTDAKEIAEALNKIIENHDTYREGALQFFASVDNKEIIRRSLEHI